jgi:hypothetical protein
MSSTGAKEAIDRMAQQPSPHLADQAKLHALTPRERDRVQIVIFAYETGVNQLAAAADPARP